VVLMSVSFCLTFMAFSSAQVPHTVLVCAAFENITATPDIGAAVGSSFLHHCIPEFCHEP